ncbi:MAG: ABC transporter ATP-binding protein [Chromatiales bacterium]
MNQPVLELRQLAKQYGDGVVTPVLRNVDLTVCAGEFVVLFGRSGSGKSTLLNLIAGLDTPTQGEVIVNGAPLTRLPERERTLFRRRHMGFVFQSFSLIPTMSVLENVLLPLQLNGESPARMRGKALQMLGELGLADKGERYPESLSGGEQQRVAIARALVHEPLLILADEPTGNLDLETGRHVLALLCRLTRAAGKTLIMATHSQEVVGRCDRMFKLVDGRAVPVLDHPDA